MDCPVVFIFLKFRVPGQISCWFPQNSCPGKQACRDERALKGPGGIKIRGVNLFFILLKWCKLKSKREGRRGSLPVLCCKQRGCVGLLLAIDVGNTNIMLGVYEENRLQTWWRISTNREQTEDEYGVIIRNLFQQSGLQPASIKAIVISSVVPPLRYPLEKMSQKYFDVHPIIVGPGVKTGLNILMDNPREVGADRVVNAIAAIELYGGPLIIVDFGTATTFCAISERGEYLGGAIAPGISISMEALFERAAKLPRVDLVLPEKVIGKNTVLSMQSGILFGFVGQVDGIVRRMLREFPHKPLVVATGGLAGLIARESETIEEVNHFLTLEGLRIIYLKNMPK